MIDMKKIRLNIDAYKQAVKNKFIELDIDYLVNLDDKRRFLEEEVNQLRRKKNELSALVPVSEATVQEQLIEKGKDNGRLLSEREALLLSCVEELHGLKRKVPGLPLPCVPIGKDESDNKELFKHGVVPGEETVPLDHLQILERHKALLRKEAVNIAGSRAYALVNSGALLEMAVLRFSYDHILNKGYVPVQAPVMVRASAMEGTGYFPFGEENAYCLEREGLYLTGTAEVGMLALYGEKLFGLDDLPLRVFGQTTCFRREAGAHGKDTRGLYRVHQFQKVEQVVICVGEPDKAESEHSQLLINAQEILQALELPYRVVDCCTGELGLGQVRKYDIETWMPSRSAYCETHSCSNFEDFQARRLNIRYKDTDGKKRFAYTLNNTALATPRILIALTENHQRENGAIYIPPALRPYLFGMDLLEVK